MLLRSPYVGEVLINHERRHKQSSPPCRSRAFQAASRMEASGQLRAMFSTSRKTLHGPAHTKRPAHRQKRQTKPEQPRASANNS